MITIIIALVVVFGTFSFALYVFKIPFAVPKTIALLSIFHLLALIVLYNFVGLDKVQINILASWKELLLLNTFFIFIVYRVQKGKGWLFDNNSIDIIFSIYLFLNITYVFLSFYLNQAPAGLAAILNGLRIQTTVVISYFTARMVTKKNIPDTNKFLKFIVFVGTIASVLAIFEIFINPIPLWKMLGVKKYLMDIAGLFEYEFTKSGVPLTYFASFDTTKGAVVQLRRTGSLFFSPLAFAQVLLITLPTALLLTMKKRLPKRHLIIQITALLSTISRGPIISVGISCFMLLIMSSFISLKNRIRIAIPFILLLCIVMFQGIEFIKATISLKDPSAASRAFVYYSSLNFMFTHPLGAGLAASEQKFTAERIGGGESEYFENVSRIGWFGFAIFFGMHLLILHKSRKKMKSKDANLALLSAIIFGVTCSLFCQEFVNRVWRHSFLPFVYGWMLGMWVTYNIATRKNEVVTNARRN